MASISITWHIADDRACPVCKGINGYTWTFETGTDQMISGQLWHPTYGLVWTELEGSVAHGHREHNCRCHLTFEVNLEDVSAKCAFLRELVQPVAGE